MRIIGEREITKPKIYIFQCDFCGKTEEKEFISLEEATKYSLFRGKCLFCRITAEVAGPPEEP